MNELLESLCTLWNWFWKSVWDTWFALWGDREGAAWNWSGFDGSPA